MSILVTGAGGGLGRALITALSGAAEASSGLVDGMTRATPPMPDGAQWDAVVHCAHGRAKDVTDRQLATYLDDGPDLTARVLRRCRRRFVLISSISVYPPVGHDLRETTPIALDAVAEFYGLAKLISEARVRRWAAETGGTAAILRLSSLLGPDSPRNVTVRVIEGAEAVPLSADSEFRYVTHAEAAATALAALARQDAPPGDVEIINVAPPDAVRLAEVARLAGRAPRFGAIRYVAPPAPAERAAALTPDLRRSSRDRIIAEIARRRGRADDAPVT